MTNVNGTLYFRAGDGSTGFELWKSDGTNSGTVLVKDIFPGGGSADPRYLTNINGTLYFRANEGINGAELWKSDGTSAGTVLVKDIVSGNVGGYPVDLMNAEEFYFLWQPMAQTAKSCGRVTARALEQA